MSAQREKFKTMNNVFDEFTNRKLFSMEATGYFNQMMGAIALGKEANVFRGEKIDGTDVAIKIYRLEVCDFNKMYYYLASDPRYTNIKRRKREIIFTWAQREYRNLLKFRDMGIRVPTPIHFTSNILLLEFIGSDGVAASQLRRDITDIEHFFLRLIEYLKIMRKNGMVHGDLSEYNLLNDNGEPVIIDCSQSTNKTDPFYEEFWERDIRNLAAFFKKHIDIDEDRLRDMIIEKGEESVLK